MKKVFSFVAVSLVLVLSASFISCKAPSGGGSNGSGGGGSIKNNYEVGDIVLNDGSAISYSAFNTLAEDEKDTIKTSAIALIFYKGADLNSDDAEGNTDTKTSRTLGVGLKHNRDIVYWGLMEDYPNRANIFEKDDNRVRRISTITCKCKGKTFDYSFTGDKNGSDNLEQIAEYLRSIDGVDDDTANETHYPAFYYCKNYAVRTAPNIIAESEYVNGWYLPSIAEIYQIYKNGIGANKVFDINEASKNLDGDEFLGYYLTSSIQSEYYKFDFRKKGVTGSTIGETLICPIREF
nr:hypothetical protein [uncultured Treponema sp.]